MAPLASSFFTFSLFAICVHSALIPPPLLNRDGPTSVTPIPSIPSCALPCIASAVAEETTCGATDLACQCAPDNASSIESAATSCVLTNCEIDQALQVLDAAEAECSSVLASASASASTAVPSSAAPTSAPAASSAIPSSPPLTPLNSSPPSAAPSSAVQSAIPSSAPNTPPIIQACAIPCIQKAIEFTNCALTNLTCQCDVKNEGIIQSATANCVIANCGGNGEEIAVDINRAQIDNCTALSASAGAGSSSITGSVTANGPTQISLTGNPSGISTAIPPCGGDYPPYYGYPPASNPTDPPSSPTSSGGDPSGAASSTPTDPGSASSTSVSVDPSGSSGSSPTPTDPSSPTSGGSGSFPSNGSTPPDPGSASSTNISVDPSASGSSGSTPTAPTSGSLPSGGSSSPTDPSGGSNPSGAASSTYPGDPSGSSSTVPPGGGSGNGGPSYGYGYGGYNPSSVPTGTGGDPGSSPSTPPSSPSSGGNGSASVSSLATGPASSSSFLSGSGTPGTSGDGGSSPSTTGGDPSAPNTSGGGASSPSTTGGDPSSPSTTSNDPSSPSTTGGDPSSPATPSSSNSSYPLPPPGGYYGYNPRPSPSATFTSPSNSTSPSPSTSPLTSPSQSQPFLLTLLPTHYTLLQYIMRVYYNLSPSSPYISSAGLTTFSREEACVFTITGEGLLSCSTPTSSRAPSKTSQETKYFGDKFSKVWETGYTIFSTRNTLQDMQRGGKDLNGTASVDATSEKPYGSLLILKNGDFIGRDNQARFCVQTPSSSNSTYNSKSRSTLSSSSLETKTQTQTDTNTDTFLPRSQVRAYINGTQTLPAGCKEVSLVIEWVGDDGDDGDDGYF